MPCGAMATTRAKLNAAISCDALIDILKAALPNEQIGYSQAGNYIQIWKGNSPLFITYNSDTGIYTVAGDSNGSVEKTLTRLSSILAVKTIAAKSKVVSTRRTKDATIMKVRV